MKKTYLLTFSISALVLLTIVIVGLMILLPQQSTIIDSSITKYDAVKKSEYVYEQTKDITKDSLVREYTISNEEISSFKSKNQYTAGNSDPFTPKGSSNNTTNGGTNSGSSSSTSTGSSNTSGNTDDTSQKVTNSNGGTTNPPSTNK